MSVDLSLGALLSMYALLLAPFAILIYLQLGLTRQSIQSVIRMSVQLLLVGLYLKYIFELNHPLVSFLWVAVMLLAANSSILGKAGLKAGPFFWRSLVGVTISTLFASGWFILIALQPEPLYDARYLVPIVGMVLGNCLRSNVVSMERFYSGIRHNEDEYITYLMLGANLKEAVRPYLREAVRSAVNPSLATMATMGIVSLPGMMTGQILGGALPMEAIKYQIAIMICIFASTVIAALLNIQISLPIAFDDYQRLRSDVFKEDRV